MAVSWKTILSVMPRLAMSLLPGIAAPGNAVVRAATRSLPTGLKGAVFEYPKLSKDFYYMKDAPRAGHETTVDGKKTWIPALNGSIDLGAANAALAQTLQEHNQAVKGGYENTLEQWWPNQDVKPRKEFHPSSSAVKSIRIADDGSIQIQWHGKNSKWYSYRGGKDLGETSRIAKDLLTSPSIGRALVRKGRYAHPDSKDLTGNPVADRNIGWWGRKYFDPRIGMMGV